MAKQSEQVQEIPISELFPFKDHPFRVLDDEAMQRTVESISQFGVLAPAIARPRPEGGYEIIAGHRRLHASQLLGLETMPVLVRQMDDDTAIITMVDSNLQRETMLPSERARAYKMKMDAMKRQGYRSDLTSGQLGRKLHPAVNRFSRPVFSWLPFSSSRKKLFRLEESLLVECLHQPSTPRLHHWSFP